MIKLYNTLTRSKDEFKPISKIGKVYIYTCGPTVYNYAHIGNLRTYIFMDLLRRMFRYFFHDIVHCMNITDVGHLVSDADEGEDKMEKASREQQKTPWEIADYYTEIFLRDIDSLNITRPEIITKATDNIGEMIAFVAALIDKGFAYETSDGIYFDIQKYPNYGVLSRNTLDELMAGARVEVNDEKHHPADFALWKKAPKEHIMQWESPWGMGYPGWHIECSAIGLKYLGEEFDIHTGGVDHIPIHHENEIAQTGAYLGHPAARFWMHGEFMMVDGGKMSKSLKNCYTLDDLRQKGYEPAAFRYMCLNAHYRQKLNFTWDVIDSAKKSLRNLRIAVHKHKGASDPVDPAFAEPLFAEFVATIADDLNIPKALGIVWTLAKSSAKSNEIYKTILQFDDVLGLDLDKEPDASEDKSADKSAAVPPEITALAESRAAAKRAKNYALADSLRKQIQDAGYVVTDTPTGYEVR